ncbi:hypothetical protein PDL71_13675 [Lacibacter sp. MH-610]|uniref:hypothetical protein n=1 Tax=Lacibacter sp. MH-610 TaxID=3020883 RepID=UPI003891CC9C
MNRTIKSAALGLVALVAVNFASATPTPYNNAAELKLVGRANNQPLYQLNINNTTAQEVVVIVKDVQGEVLHYEVLKGTNLSRTFLLNVDASQEADLRVEVINRNSRNKAVLEFADSTAPLSKK